MGNVAAGLEHKFNPDIVPLPNQASKFDPLYGFPNGRPEKVMVATEEEMRAAKLPLDKRDYCAHLLLDYQRCRKNNFPFLYRCHHEKHHYLTCEYHEFVDSMKDYEREKRLLSREKKKGRLGELQPADGA